MRCVVDFFSVLGGAACAVSIWMAVLAAAGTGCDRGVLDCHAATATATAEGIVIADGCDRASVRLLPRARIEGTWRGAGQDGACAASDRSVECPAGDYGQVAATVEGEKIGVRFIARRDTVIQGLSLEGTATLDGATAWLSNGLQSWSQSGVIALGPPPSEDALSKALADRGDAEVIRGGSELSNWYTYVGGGEVSLFAGALSAERFRPWVQVSRAEATGLGVRLVSGASGEQVAVPAGAAVHGEPWRVEVGDDLESMFKRYGRALLSRRASFPAAAQAGWNSWYELWASVDEQSVRANAALAGETLAAYLPGGGRLRIVIDDGWQWAWGEWEPNAKFPSGMDGLARDLHEQGFEVGIWLAPLLVDDDSALVGDHPDWFVSGADYVHSTNGRMRILDATHPDAAAHLAQVIERIVSWGYDFLKIDFLFVGTYEGGRAQAATGMEAYQRALEIIREAAGEETILLAVGAPPIPSLPFVDAWRIGGDIAFEPFGPSWHFAVNQARSIAARWPLCHAMLCDPDPLIQRVMSREEVGFSAWVVAIAGGGLFLSDDLRNLPQERHVWGLDASRVGASLGGVPATPESHFPTEPPVNLANPFVDLVQSKNTHVLPPIWRMPDGTRVVFNLGDEALEVEGVSVPAHAARGLP